jgi:hypothetical protein
MAITEEEKCAVRTRVVQQFGEDRVKKIDALYVELNKIRVGCKDSFEFLDKLIETYSDPEIGQDFLIAAILWGMVQGEIGYEYYLLTQQSQIPPIGYG